MRGYIEIYLKEQDLQFIKDILDDSSSTNGERRRAQLLLALYSNKIENLGLSDYQIAKAANVNKMTITRLKKKLQETNSIGKTIKRKNYEENTKRNKPSLINRNYIMMIKSSTPPEGKNHWTYRLISEHYNKKYPTKSISHTAVAKVIKELSI
jgi:transposase